VLILDLDDGEAAKLLALHDPLAGMAEANDEALADLLMQVDTENDAVRALLDGMLGDPELLPSGDDEAASPGDVDIPEAFQVVVQCRDESEQRAVFERLSGEGYRCKLLML